MASTVCLIFFVELVPRTETHAHRASTHTHLEDVLVGGTVVQVAADGGDGVVEGHGVLHLKTLRGSNHIAELAVAKSVLQRERSTQGSEEKHVRHVRPVDVLAGMG